MQTKYDPQNLGDFDKNKKYTIVFTEWNEKYVNVLLNDCKNTLESKGIKNISLIKVPGSLELTFGALKAIENGADVIIVIGTVIRGGTSHYQHVCDGVTHGIINLQIKTGKPIVFGVLTCDNEQQIKQRLGKGKEWALSAMQLSVV